MPTVTTVAFKVLMGLTVCLISPRCGALSSGANSPLGGGSRASNIQPMDLHSQGYLWIGPMEIASTSVGPARSSGASGAPRLWNLIKLMAKLALFLTAQAPASPIP